MDPVLSQPQAYQFLMLDMPTLRMLGAGASGNARTGRNTGAASRQGGPVRYAFWRIG